MEAHYWRVSPQYIRPKGIATHQALHAVRCDECGQTYWSSDEYGSHTGCKGPIRETGFR